MKIQDKAMGMAISILLGCSVLVAFTEQENSPVSNSDKSPYAELRKVPEKARTRRNPFEGDSEAAAAGRKLFAQRCAECHGNSAEGARKGPSLRAEEVQEASPGTLFWILTNGVVRRGMPVWSKLPEAQRWQIVTYLQSLRAPTNSPPPTQR